MEETDLRRLDELNSQVAALTRAVKIGFLAVMAVTSYFNIRLACAIPAFGQIYKDMLNGKRLPSMTEAALAGHGVLAALSICILLGAIGAAFLRRPVQAVAVISALLLASVVQIIVTWQALSLPLLLIIQTMQGS